MKILKSLETAITMDITDSQSDKIKTELVIEKIISNGCGLARYSGRAVFIPFTVPGERILAEIDLSGKKFLEGRLLEVVESSPDRVDAPCRYYTRCGGCSLQHINYERQLEIKKELVTEAFMRNGRISIPEPEIVSGSPYSYRCRIQLHPAGDGESGFRERKGSRVVAVESCPVCNDGINSYLSSGERKIGERTVVFSPDSREVYLSTDDNSPVKVGLGNFQIETDPGSFFQSNISLFKKAIEEIRKHAAGNTLLDLYAGAAVFGTALSDKFSRIISVEENSRALECGKRNIPGRDNLEKKFFPCTVEKYISSGRGRKKGKNPVLNPDTVITDPPRTGLSKDVRRYLKNISPEILIYLSCDYATMARDAGDLSECYNIKMVKIYDFYPQTPHAETLAVLVRK